MNISAKPTAQLVRLIKTLAFGLLAHSATAGTTISETNYALGSESYMVRLTDTLPPPSYANDGNLSTVMETTDKTVDGYWETDLGEERALSRVRVIGVDSAAEQARLAHATVRLFDANHQSIFSKHLDGASSTFDVALPGPVLARYVRVGFENKERSHATGGIEWWLKIREVEAYGQPASHVGILSFTASDTEISSGKTVNLNWQVAGVQTLEIHPAIGSVGAATAADGTGQISVAPTATAEYIMVGTTPTATFIRHVTVRVNGQSLPPRISEIVAANKFSLRDGFKDAPDWIEIHNPNAGDLDLSGYCLSDDAAQPAQWTFPAGTILPGHGYLVVGASGRNLPAPDAAGYLHAGFSLAAGGESVLLSTPGGTTVLDSIPYPALDEDLAYGRTLDQNWAFIEPTPGKANLAKNYQGWLLPPVFSETRGIRTAGFPLTLNNPNPDSQLMYSLDGSDPSIAYTGPLTISNSRSVRANVRREGYRSPRAVTHSYLFPAAVPTAAGMNQTYASGSYLTRQTQGFQDLPMVSLTVPNLPDDYVEIEGSAEFFLPGSANPVVQVNCGVERFGGAWTGFAKKSYKLGFSAEYGARKLEAPLFNGFDRGFPVKEAFDSLELRACNHDMVARGFYVGARFIEDTTLEMGSLNPHGRFAHLFVNGTYWGMYDMRERLVDAFLAEYLGGAKEDYVNVRGNDNVGSTTFIPGTPDPPNRELWETVRANRGSYAAIKDKVDVSHLIDFMLVWFYGYNENEFRCAGPVVSGGSGFKFWLADADGYLYSPNVSAALTSDRTGNAGPGSIFGALVTEGHPDFKILLADRIQKHFFNNGALTPARNLARLNARMTEIQNAMVSECARWGYRTPENWATAAESIRTGLFPQRTNNLLTYIRNRGLFPALSAPVLSQHGGSVNQGYALTFSSTGGTVYFTLDGSDPRLPGGAISPTAQSWSGTAQTLIPLGSTWKFRDQGSLPATNWHTSAYSDTDWASGPAQLGYGDGGEATVVSYGPNSNNRYLTTYFRKSFHVTNPAQFSQLTVGLVRDDGAVVYLNGVEVARSNMPGGGVTYATTAASAVGGADESAVQNITIPANLLVEGSNLIAVEIHQHSANSTDLSFDLSLTAAASGIATTIESNTRVLARVLNGSTWSALSDATFRVAYPLVAKGPYIFEEWSSSAAPGSHPPNMTFYQTSAAIPDPGLQVEMESPWLLPYNRDSRSRVNGLGGDGFSWINTSDPQNESGSGFMGSAVLALNTAGAQDIQLSWTGGTVAPNTRDYGVRLQYRVGDTGSFKDVTNNGNPVEYLRNALPGHSQTIGPVTLPTAASNQPLVQLRWKYYHRSGTSGSRAQLRVDDIQVSAGHPAPSELRVVSAPVVGQAGRELGPITVEARASNGALATGFNGPVQLSVAGVVVPIGGTISRQASGGVVVFDDIRLDVAGQFVFTASAAGLLTGEADPATRVLGLIGNIVPRIVQGKTPVNDERVPFAAHFSISGLRANSTYRFANRMVVPADAVTSNGAGNMIFVGAPEAPFARSMASPSFLPADRNVGHGEFTSDSQGAFSGWFITEPTGNDRFTPGNTLHPLLLLNDGEGGTSAFHPLLLELPVQVMNFGPAAGQGTAVYGDCAATGKSFVVIYDETSGSSRPLAATPVENTGVATDALYAGFYQTQVAGQDSRWGTMLPNNLASGIRRIEARAGQTGALISAFLAADAHRPTTGLAGGTNAVGIHFPGPAASGFAHWQARHFSLAELALPAIGGADGTPAGDGVCNLLKYAFGMPPFSSSREGLPVASLQNNGGNPVIQFQYQRLTGPHGLGYHLEISDALSGWIDAETSLLPTEKTQPATDGTEKVLRFLPVQPDQPERFLRLRIDSF